jgi:hypothetical protein
MFKIINPEGDLVAEVSRIILTSKNNQYIDKFVDGKGNLYILKDLTAK